MRPGDRVVAVESIGTGFFSSVPRGTLGYVVEYHHNVFNDSVTVKFDNGQVARNINHALVRRA